MLKSFLKWIEEKYQIHTKTKNPRPFKDREIWWCAIGQNVGFESNGKSEFFSRPVLVIKKLSNNSFIGLPLTSKEKQGSWYVSITQKGKKSAVMLNQIRFFDEKRLYSKIGELDDTDWQKVKKQLKELLKL